MQERKKLLIFGAAGFLGRNIQDFIVERELDAEFELYLLDLQSHKSVYKNILAADVSKRKNLFNVLAETKPDFVINFIGNFKPSDFPTGLLLNTSISINILQACLSGVFAPEKIILVGSAAEYGKPTELPLNENSLALPQSIYGITKQFQTMAAGFYANQLGVPVIVARPFNIFGKYFDSKLAIGRFIHLVGQAATKSTIKVGNLSTRRDYINASDVASALIALIKKGHPGEIYNICSGESYSTEEILNAIIEISGKIMKVECDEKLMRDNDIENVVGSYTKIQNHTGWCPSHDFWGDLKRLAIQSMQIKP